MNESHTHPPIRVVLVDDHHVVRRGLQSYLETQPGIAIVGSASNGEEVLEKIERWLPDVVVMDMLMPGGIDGIETTRRLREITPHTQVVVLTAFTDDARVIGALRAGAIGYIRKESDPAMLLTAIRAAVQGQSTIDPTIAASVLEEMSHAPLPGLALTERETEVLRQLANGLTNKQIADALIIGEETVKTHVGNILSKLHLSHRGQAVVYALKKGLLSLDELEI